MTHDHGTSTARTLGRWSLAGLLAFTGTAHLVDPEPFRAQVPPWLPAPELIIVVSGVIELALAVALVTVRRRRALLGWVVAGFFVAVFPGNIAQFATGTDAFGLDTDAARAFRLLFQPLFVVWALWCTGAWSQWRAGRAVDSTGQRKAVASPGRRALQNIAAVLIAVLVGAAIAAAGSSGGLTIGGWPVFALCTALAYLINWVAYVPAYLRRTEQFFDLAGTGTYLTVLGVALFAGSRSPLSVVLAVVVAIWALRLGTFLVRRIRREGADRRFDQLKADPGRFLVTWTMQALWVTLTAGAALAAMTSTGDERVGAVSVLGLVLWAIGFAIEAVADAQKRSFRSNSANHGRFITTGLWAWSRHPNYFGEITLWVGVALMALPALTGWQHVTMVSPLFVALLLTRVSGIPPLEARAEKAWGDDPDYRAYVERTPALVPRRPVRA